MAEVLALNLRGPCAKADAVQHVERLGAELHANRFPDRERAGKRHILVQVRKQPDLRIVASGIAKSVERRIQALSRERTRLIGNEEIVHLRIEIAAFGGGAPSFVRSDVGSASAVEQRKSVAGRYADRLTARVEVHAADAPVADDPRGRTLLHIVAALAARQVLNPPQ